MQINRRIFLANCAAAMAAFGQEKDRPLEAFLRWSYKSGTRLPRSPEGREQVLAQFKESLLNDGAPEDEAEAALSTIRGASDEQREAARWNVQFSSPGYRVNRKPNEWLVQAVEGRKPGRALDAGVGFGRNAVYLAQQGWEVTGFDIADKALAMTRENAAQAGVEVQTILESSERFDYGKDKWDLITEIYEFDPLREHAGRIMEALAPAGILVAEGMERSRTAPFGYGPGELLELLKDFRVMKYEDVEGTSDYGLYRTNLIRAIACRRA